MRVLHLLNDADADGIAPLVANIIGCGGVGAFEWHTGGLASSGQKREQPGLEVVDLSRNAGVLRALRRYVVERRIEIVNSHSPRTALTAALALIGLRRVTRVASEHLFYAPGDRRFGAVYVLLDRLSLYSAGHIVAVSHEMRDRIAALPGICSEGITVVPNGVDTKAFYVPEARGETRRELGISAEAPVFVFTGRIAEQKRLDLLVRGFAAAYRAHPGARCVIAGSGDLRVRSSIEALATELGVAEALIWTGFRTDIPRILAAADIYTQTSDNEGLARSVLEAMAAEKATIATSACGTAELLGSTGILVPCGDAGALGREMCDLVADSDRRRSLGKAARDRVTRDFGVERMALGYRRLYERLKMISSNADMIAPVK